jgi:hypothetical protein
MHTGCGVVRGRLRASLCRKTDVGIQAHIGGHGYKLPVQAVRLATVSCTLDRAGSFEVESHHLEDHRDLEVQLVQAQVSLGLIAVAERT